MILHQTGNLLAVDKGYIVHGCNAQGVMGGGVAAQVRFHYPDVYSAYIASGHKLGTLSYQQYDELVVVNAVTQEYYGRDNRLYTSYDAVRNCFKDLAALAETLDVPKIVNFPLIGCGLGGGDWRVVQQIIEEELGDDFVKILWTLDTKYPG